MTFGLLAQFSSELQKVRGEDPLKKSYTDIGAIISFILPYILVLSGILLFIFLVMGGFDLMTSAGDPKKMEQGKEKIMAAIVGFIIVFIAYWLYQIIAFIFGIKI